MPGSASEALLRVLPGLILFLGLAVLEWRLPRRRSGLPRRRRWTGNLGILLLNTLVLRLLVPAAAVGAALTAGSRGWGAFNSLTLPAVVVWPATVLALDLLTYAQHRLFHRVPWLWRLHRMHHADTDVDVTTGVRFHPGEILVSVAIRMAAVTALGAPAGAVLLFEVLLNATSMFNHSNLAIPVRADRLIRRFLVTPDMHRVHHSVRPEETDSNFGFNLPWWDWWFGSYRPAPADGHEAMTLGLSRFRGVDEQRLHRLLLQPFR